MTRKGGECKFLNFVFTYNKYIAATFNMIFACEFTDASSFESQRFVLLTGMQISIYNHNQLLFLTGQNVNLINKLHRAILDPGFQLKFDKSCHRLTLVRRVGHRLIVWVVGMQPCDRHHSSLHIIQRAIRRWVARSRSTKNRRLSEAATVCG